MILAKLAPGGDIREDWRTTNEIVAQVNDLTAGQARNASAIAELRRRIPAAGGSGGVRWVEVDGIGDLANDFVSVDLDGASVDVALPWLLRAAQSPSEDHFRYPEYATGQWLAIARPPDGTGIEGVEWVDLGDARGWAQTLLVCSLGT